MDIMHYLRPFGIWVALAYLISTLFAWIYAVFRGYTYFSAGEPIELLRNIEWFIGVVAVICLSHELLSQFNDKVVYDPPI